MLVLTSRMAARSLAGGRRSPGFGLSVGDGAADLGGDLFVEVGGVSLAHLDIQHGDSNTSIIVGERRRP